MKNFKSLENLKIKEKVLNKLRSLSACGFRSELKELDGKLSMITAVLLDDEKQQVKKYTLSWLRRLEDVLYHAEDVFDKFEYEALWSQVMNHPGIKRNLYMAASKRG